MKKKKKQKKTGKSNIEKCHSIRLGDAKINNNGSTQKTQEKINCEKNNKEFMDNVAIPCLMINAPIQSIKEEQKNSDVSTTLDNQDNYNLENENDPFNLKISSPE